MMSSGYTPKTDVEFDALPDEAPPLEPLQKKRPFLRLVDARRSSSKFADLTQESGSGKSRYGRLVDFEKR